MTGDELRAFVKITEVNFSQARDNIYEFPSGRQMGADEVGALLDLEDLEIVLDEWD